MKLKTENRLIYPDLLRVISMLFVIIIHVTSIGIRECDHQSLTWIVHLGLNSISRWSVPMFFMISGMFFLDPENNLDIKLFFSRNVKKVILSIIITGFCYALIDQYTYSAITPKSFLIAVYGVITNHSGYHLWFLYDLLMLYLATPVIRIFIKHAAKRYIQYALICWFFFSLLIGQINTAGREMAGISSIVNYQALNLTGYAGYYVLGYYLRCYPPKMNEKKLIFIAGMLAFIFIPILTIVLSKRMDTEISCIHSPMGMGSMMISIALMELLSGLEKDGHLVRYAKFAKIAGSCTIIVYLIHPAIITLVLTNIMKTHASSIGFTMIGILSVFSGSYALALMCKLIVSRIRSHS